MTKRSNTIIRIKETVKKIKKPIIMMGVSNDMQNNAIQNACSSISQRNNWQAIAKNRECLRHHQLKIHELIDIITGIKPFTSVKVKNYQRTQADEQRLLWTLKIMREQLIKPLQDEYATLLAEHV